MVQTSGPIATGATTRCPICNSQAQQTRPAPGWGEWRTCSDCLLEFVDPMRLPAQPEALYTAAYRGQRHESDMQQFHDRIRQREILIEEKNHPELWFWTPAFNDILQWLKHRLRPGATVLEVGCGLGFFLHTLRKNGFNAVGLDVAEPAVDLNRRDGFQVWHGPVETVPDGWVEPDAVVCFFMMHHLEDPLAFLSTIRQKWPGAPLAIAQYGPSNRDPVATTPPRTLAIWSSRALGSALQRAGYSPRVKDVRGSGMESPIIRPIRRIAKKSISIPWLYLINRQIERKVLTRFSQPTGREAYVVCAVAEPAERTTNGVAR